MPVHKTGASEFVRVCMKPIESVTTWCFWYTHTRSTCNEKVSSTHAISIMATRKRKGVLVSQLPTFGASDSDCQGNPRLGCVQVMARRYLEDPVFVKYHGIAAQTQAIYYAQSYFYWMYHGRECALHLPPLIEVEWMSKVGLGMQSRIKLEFWQTKKR